MKDYKVIVFDMDGVLFNSVYLAENFIRRRYPTASEETLKNVLLGNFHEELEKIKHLKIEETEEEKEANKEKYAKEKAKAPLYEGVKELLDYLKQNSYIIALNTSAYDRNCLPMLETSGILDKFDFIGTAEISKSKVDKFKVISSKYGVNMEEMLFVTDTLGDIKEAHKARVPTIGVTWGAHDREYLLKEKCDNLIKIVDKIEELKDFIK